MSKKTPEDKSDQPATGKSEIKDSSARLTDGTGERSKPAGKGRDRNGPGSNTRSNNERNNATALSTPGTPRGGFTAALALLLAIAAAGFSGWQMVESRRSTAALELEVATKLTEMGTIGSDSRKLSAEARDIARDLEVRLGQLDARFAGMQNKSLALESIYQDLSQTRDAWTLTEVEQILLVASQQLQLASNLGAALVALEAADARLAKSDRPQITQLRRVIAEDIERLKSSPYVDVTGISLKLEGIISSIDSLPLAIEIRPAVSSGSAGATAAPNGWRALLSEAWNDLRSLVRIERMDSREGELLAPEQRYFLRENLKLRLLGARLALLARDQISYKADLAAATEWIAHYFDANAQPVASAIETLNQLAKSEIVVELPDVGASLDAVRNYRLMRERTAR